MRRYLAKFRYHIVYSFLSFRKYIQKSVEQKLSKMFGKILTLQQEGMGRSLHDDQNIHQNQDRMKGNVNKC